MESKGSQVQALLVFSILQSADWISKSLLSVRQNAWHSSCLPWHTVSALPEVWDTNKCKSQWTQRPTTYNFRPSANQVAAWMETVGLLSSHVSLHIQWNLLNPNLSGQKSQQAWGKEAPVPTTALKREWRTHLTQGCCGCDSKTWHKGHGSGSRSENR